MGRTVQKQEQGRMLGGLLGCTFWKATDTALWFISVPYLVQVTVN